MIALQKDGTLSVVIFESSSNSWAEVLSEVADWLRKRDDDFNVADIVPFEDADGDGWLQRKVSVYLWSKPQ